MMTCGDDKFLNLTFSTSTSLASQTSHPVSQQTPLSCGAILFCDTFDLGRSVLSTCYSMWERWVTLDCTFNSW